MDAEIDLAVSIEDDGASFQYTLEGSTAVVYTMTYANTGRSRRCLASPWAGHRAVSAIRSIPTSDWACIVDPYTLEGATPVPETLASLVSVRVVL